MRSRLSAILWLHLVRLSRYKYGFINFILVTILWYLIYLLGALMFVPEDEVSTVAIITFWGVVLWSMMNNCVWLIAGWTWFILVTGLAEEHIIHNVNPLLFITGRFLTGFSVSLATIPLVVLVFISFSGYNLLSIYNPFYLVLGISLILVYATLYALTLASLSLRTNVPGPMLDIVNIFMYIGGGIGIPLYRMPSGLREFTLLVPYTHAAEITRYGVLGIEPYIGLGNELIIAFVYLLIMLSLTLVIVRRVVKYIRLHGVKAIGRM